MIGFSHHKRFMLAIGTLVVFGCRPARVIPGLGASLKVRISGQDLDPATLDFSRDTGEISNPDCEMEGSFKNGETLRVPCRGSGAIICDFPVSENMSNSVQTTRTITMSDLAKLPIPPKHISGRTEAVVSQNGTSSSFEAIFPTLEIPKSFRIIMSGKIIVSGDIKEALR